MSDYISREAAIDSLVKLERTARHNSVLWPDHVEECREVLRSIPAADVRPVVLCRDCKYAPIGDKDGSDLEWPFDEFDGNPCPYKCLDNWYSQKPAPDSFCAAGERKTNCGADMREES